MIAADVATEIAASARELLQRELPREQMLARLRSEPLSRKAWRAAAEVGWFRLLTSGRAGGLEAGAAGLAALFREIGRFLPAGPFKESVVAGGLLRDHADLGADECVITFGQGLLEHADQADLLLVPVAGGIAAVSPAAARIAPVTSVDLVGRPCLVELAEEPTSLLAGGAGLLEPISLYLAVASIAELAGLSAEMLDLSVAYAKERVQFDRPIGAFQAVQHRLAEMAVTLGALDAALAAAVALAEGDEPSRAEQVRALHGYSAGLARALVESALQVHGGIGFTAAHRLHAYLKRALRLQALAEADGDPVVAMGALLLRR